MPTTKTRWPFSNFIEIPGGLPGYEWNDENLYGTLEHAFQAAKTLDPAQRAKIAAAKSPGSAKWLGKRVTLRAGWNDMRLDVMRLLLALKWGGEPFRSQLLASGDEPLIEQTTWHDLYWGKCICPKHDGAGQNHLGRLLMETRSQLRAESA